MGFMFRWIFPVSHSLLNSHTARTGLSNCAPRIGILGVPATNSPTHTPTNSSAKRSVQLRTPIPYLQAQPPRRLGGSAPREEVCPIAALSRRVGCSSSRKPSSNPKQAEVCPIVPPSPHPTPTSSPPCRQASPPPSANLAPTQCEESSPIAADSPAMPHWDESFDELTRLLYSIYADVAKACP